MLLLVKIISWRYDIFEGGDDSPVVSCHEVPYFAHYLCKGLMHLLRRDGGLPGCEQSLRGGGYCRLLKRGVRRGELPGVGRWGFVVRSNVAAG